MTATDTTSVITGTCLCGAVTFSIQSNVQSPRYCHCRSCRKFAGTSPAAWGVLPRAELHITSVAANINRYHSGSGTRCFCATCGSPLWFEPDAFVEILGIPLGVLDGAHIAAPQEHLWTSAMPAWSCIHDDLPQLPEGPQTNQGDTL